MDGSGQGLRLKTALGVKSISASGGAAAPGSLEDLKEQVEWREPPLADVGGGGVTRPPVQ